jgi:alpha-tubulin suppressor-like RCC1 family protein
MIQRPKSAKKPKLVAPKPPLQHENSTTKLLLKKRKSLKKIKSSNKLTRRKSIVRIENVDNQKIVIKKKIIYDPKDVTLTALKARYRLNICGWGWNSSGRSGNITDENVYIPRPVQRSNIRNYISCAAGKNHSLFVSDEGNIYSIGDGSKGQLGYGNMFTNAMISSDKKGGFGGTTQATPLPVTPTGKLKFGRDIQCIQVAAGGTFSIAREATPEEGSSIVDGFLQLEGSIKGLLERYPDSEAIKRAWCFTRQERFIINRKAEGIVTAWGTGPHGELGLGRDIKYSPYPQINFWFRKVCIKQISTGERHCLAIDSEGFLFSWGCGRSGRLGHGDFESRHRPERVKFFEKMIVSDCSAGDAHSAVLTVARADYTGSPTDSRNKISSGGGGGGGKTSSSGQQQLLTRRVLCFGRGAHGRLGNGTNRNMHTPVLVRKWPASLTGGVGPTDVLQFEKIVCGGAHTAVLAYRQVPKSLVFPFGIQTFVLSWGFGTNGQLGTGLVGHSFLPVKAKLPKTEIIVGLSAGRSWTIARTLGGNLFTWGKGLRGQLGQQTEEQEKIRFSLAPREVTAYGNFLSVDSSFAHSVGITTPKKLMNLKRIDYLMKNNQNGGLNPFQVSKSLLTLKHRPAFSQWEFHCCKRSSAIRPFIIMNAPLRKGQLPVNNENNKAISKKYNLKKSLSKRTEEGQETAMIPSNIIIPDHSSSSSAPPLSQHEFESYRYACLTCHLTDVCYYCLQLCHKSHIIEQIQKNSSSFFYEKSISTQHEILATNNNPVTGTSAGGKTNKNSNSLSSGTGKTADPFMINLLQSQDTLNNPVLFTLMKKKRKKFNKFKKRRANDEQDNSAINTNLMNSPADDLYNAFQQSLKSKENCLKTLPFDDYYCHFHSNNIFPRRLKAKYNEIEFYPLNFLWKLPKLSSILDKDNAAPSSPIPGPPAVTPKTPKTPKTQKNKSPPTKSLNKSPSTVSQQSPAAGASSLKKAPSYGRLAAIQRQPSSKLLKKSKSRIDNNLSRNKSERFQTDLLILTPEEENEIVIKKEKEKNQEKKSTPPTACQCSLFHSACRIAPNIEETVEEYLPPTEKEKDKETEKHATEEPPLQEKRRSSSMMGTSSIKSMKKKQSSSSSVVPKAAKKQPPPKPRENKFFSEDILKALQSQKDRQLLNRYIIPLQALARGYNQRKAFQLQKQDHILIRREVCTNHVQKFIFEPIFEKLWREYALYSEDRENRQMGYEDDLMHQFDYYTKLQLSLLGMNGMEFAVKQMIGKVSIQLPIIETEAEVRESRKKSNERRRASVQQQSPESPKRNKDSNRQEKHGNNSNMKKTVSFDEQFPESLSTKSSVYSSKSHGIKPMSSQPQKNIAKPSSKNIDEDDSDEDDDDKERRKIAEEEENESVEENIHWYPSYSFTFSSLRHQQMTVHPRDRFPVEVMARLSHFFPVNTSPGFFKEGEYYDKDVLTLVSKYIYKPETTERLFFHLLKLLKIRQEREKSAALALQKMKKRQLSINMTQNTLTVRQRNELLQQQLKQQQELQQNRSSFILRNGGQQEQQPLVKLDYNNDWKEEMDLFQYINPVKSLPQVLSEARFLNFPSSAAASVLRKYRYTLESIKNKNKKNPASENLFVKNVNDFQFIQDEIVLFKKKESIKRRFTLSNPERLYRRLTMMPEVLYEKNNRSRRYSLPEEITDLYSKTGKQFQRKKYYDKQRQEILSSLSLYELKKESLVSIIDEKFENLAKKKEESEALEDKINNKANSRTSKKPGSSGGSYKKKKKGIVESSNKSTAPATDTDTAPVPAAAASSTAASGVKEKLGNHPVRLDYVNSYQNLKKEIIGTFHSSVLTPALPREMIDLMKDHSRRRSIGEPERLLPQLNSVMDIREFFISLIQKTDEQLHLKRRRRSFDYHEEKDLSSGVLAQLDMVFQDEKEVLLTHSLQKDSNRMNKRIEKAGFAFDPEKEKREKQQKQGEEDEDEENEETKEKKRAKKAGESEEKGAEGTWGSTSSSRVTGDEKKESNNSKGKPPAKNISRSRKAGETSAHLQNLQPQPGMFSIREDDHDSAQPQQQQRSLTSTNSSANLFPVRPATNPNSKKKPELWQEHYTDDGLTYFYNPETEESLWERPEGNQVQMLVMYLDEGSGQNYWLNHSTGEAYWMDGRIKE